MDLIFDGNIYVADISVKKGFADQPSYTKLSNKVMYRPMDTRYALLLLKYLY